MAEKFDLGNAQNWEEAYSQTFEAELVADYRFRPIGKVDIPILLGGSILAVYTESPPAPAHWQRAGWLNQKIRLGITVGGGQEGNRNQGRLMLLNQIVVVEWPSITEEYQVTFTPQRYLQQVDLRIWKYIGPISEPMSEQIDLVRLGIVRIEKTLQFVANRDVPTQYTEE